MNIKDTAWRDGLRHEYVIAIAANERKTGVRSPALLRVLRALDKEASMARHMMKRRDGKGSHSIHQEGERSMKKLIIAALLVLGLTSVASAQSTTANLLVTANVAAACSLSTSGVAFGSYDPTAGSPLDTTGSITATCTQGTGQRIELGPGLHPGGFFGRTLAGPGSSVLEYGLFKDAARSLAWGDGTVNGAALAIAPAPNSSPRIFTVYGRLSAGQSVEAGSYSDVVLVTLVF